MDYNDAVSIVLIILLFVIGFASIPFAHAEDTLSSERHLLSFENTSINESLFSEDEYPDNVFERIWIELKLNNYIRFKELYGDF